MTVQLQWSGVDGTVWPLTVGNTVFVNAAKVEGLGMPKYDRNTMTSAGRDGQRLTGLRSRAEPREGSLPVVISATPTTWQAIQRAWWNSWSPDVAGTLTCIGPDGSARSIRAYLSSDDSYGNGMDPSIWGYEEVVVDWIADDPWWYGTTVVQSFAAADAGDFLVNGTALPFALSGAQVSGTMSLNNPGELPASPVFVMTAGTTAFSITIDGHTVAGSITVPAGSTLTLDSYLQSAILTDSSGTQTSVLGSLSAFDFTTIGVGVTSAISASLTGTGTLTISLAPRYRRAY